LLVNGFHFAYKSAPKMDVWFFCPVRLGPHNPETPKLAVIVSRGENELSQRLDHNTSRRDCTFRSILGYSPSGFTSSEARKLTIVSPLAFWIPPINSEYQDKGVNQDSLIPGPRKPSPPNKRLFTIG